jgi:uncharacterized protein YecT (DUF1311 family)
MNKNRGIWIVIGSILVIGILITLATFNFVKSRQKSSESMGITGFSNSGTAESRMEAKSYGRGQEPFSPDRAAPQEAPAPAEVPVQRAASPASAPLAETVPENSPQPADAGFPVKSAGLSGENEPALPAEENSVQASAEGTVISPISPDSKYRPAKSAASLEGADYYQKQLQDLDAQIKKMREDSGSSNTYSVKSLADKELRLWTREQDVIYTAILEEVTEEERKTLEDSQQAWIKSRDAKAEESAKRYSGGSLEEVEYTASLAESARERTYALVEEYTEVLSLREGP